MLRFLTTCVCLLAFVGCATGLLPPADPPKAISLASGGPTATVILNRVSHTVYRAAAANVLLDGKQVGTVTNGQCVRLTIPAGNHNLQLTTGLLSNLGGALGNAIASSLKSYNVKIAAGQRQFFSAKPYYDGPSGWLFRVTKEATGQPC